MEECREGEVSKALSSVSIYGSLKVLMNSLWAIIFLPSAQPARWPFVFAALAQSWDVCGFCVRLSVFKHSGLFVCQSGCWQCLWFLAGGSQLLAAQLKRWMLSSERVAERHRKTKKGIKKRGEGWETHYFPREEADERRKTDTRRTARKKKVQCFLHLGGYISKQHACGGIFNSHIDRPPPHFPPS